MPRNRIRTDYKQRGHLAPSGSYVLRVCLAVLAVSTVLATLPTAAAQASTPTSARSGSQPLRVVTTIGMLADVARNVGGNCVDVTAIMGPGVDPHLYKASARDVTAFRDADVILYSGYGLEGQLGDVLQRFSEQQPTMAVAPASIQPADLLGMANLHGIDPHLWMDVSLWAKTVPTIATKITELAPACAEQVTANAQAYAAQLQALHGWIREAIGTIPAERRLMVTAHDAFGYYGRAYGIEVAGIQGISTESEAGIADIRDMARLVAERQVPVVFVESTINPRTIQAVVDAARQLGQDVDVGSQLFSDAMGAEDTHAGTYLGMLFANTRTITEALGGQAPPLPAALEAWGRSWELE